MPSCGIRGWGVALPKSALTDGQQRDGDSQKREPPPPSLLCRINRFAGSVPLGLQELWENQIIPQITWHRFLTVNMVLYCLRSFKSKEKVANRRGTGPVRPARTPACLCDGGENCTLHLLQCLLCFTLVLNEILQFVPNQQVLVSVSGLKKYADARPSHWKEWVLMNSKMRLRHWI